jgi:hypothetical protein
MHPRELAHHNLSILQDTAMRHSCLVGFQSSPRSPRAQAVPQKAAAKKAAQDPILRRSSVYCFWYTKWPRRFSCQHASVCSVQKGFSLP